MKSNYSMNQNINFNNQPGVNQMNQHLMNNSNVNSIYDKTISKTINNFRKPTLEKINFNDRSNILSLINLPIIIPYHKEHPLINCKTPGRIKKDGYWVCDNCNNNYTFNIPSFYCTACDFDICQKCFLKLNAFMIGVYNYSESDIYNSQQFKNTTYYEPNLHKHPIVRIIREPTYIEVQLKCNMCINDIQKEEEFYYCSLCNYCICIKCHQNCKNYNINNDTYIDSNMMFQSK